MDGPVGITQCGVQPSQTLTYDFVVSKFIPFSSISSNSFRSIKLVHTGIMRTMEDSTLMVSEDLSTFTTLPPRLNMMQISL